MLRRNHNDYIRSLAKRGINVLDFDKEIAGVTDSFGQVQMKVGTQNDTIHPNDAGNLLLKNILKRYLVDYIG